MSRRDAGPSPGDPVADLTRAIDASPHHGLDLHLRPIVAEHAALPAAGVCEVVVFRSTAAELHEHHQALPFAVVPDPSEALYAEFGVLKGWQAVLNPRAWPAGIRGVLKGLPRLPAWPARGQGALGLPGDFLIAPDGRVLEARIGSHAYDQWSVEDILRLARRHAPPPAPHALPPAMCS